MFSKERIKELVEAGLPDCTTRVHNPGNDGEHFQAEVVSTAFVGASLIKQHKMVYGTLGDAVGTDIHALQLKTFTPERWPYGE